ncbi:hypothetical protein [Thalassospira australica]|uniref:hypothetical protein n=1 Tax=Thalassospira australica TaxID=1528106 RepID=UPI00051A5993|nr:hypothetical protein [Thalassospira australica]
MSLSLAQYDLTTRCRKISCQIADDLTRRQQADGTFALPDFYAKAFAINLWTQLDRNRFHANIERALTALKTEPQDRGYHREFIEYAFRETPGLSEETIAGVLRNAPSQSPDVANWQILGLMNRQKRDDGLGTKLTNLAHFALIRCRYWRSPLFLDRPNCFSAQYHAFCAALLSDSPNKHQQRLARTATKLLAALSGTHGYANLTGRGAGQSFGAVCALYALIKHGYQAPANAILDRIEKAVFTDAGLPLNLLAAAPLPDAPGPANPETPGWYNYNRHDDYLAFAGYWLCKAAKLPMHGKHPSPAGTVETTSHFAHFSSRHYHAQMALRGKQVFDVSGAPVIVSGQGTTAKLLLPPTGGEQDVPSLYDKESHPLPAIGTDHFARFLRTKHTADNTFEIAFELRGIAGTRKIEFQDHQVIISDGFPDTSGQCADLFRILFDGRIDLIQTAERVIICPALGIQMHANTALQIDHSPTFSAAGPAMRVSAPNANKAKLVIIWGKPNA